MKINKDLIDIVGLERAEEFAQTIEQTEPIIQECFRKINSLNSDVKVKSFAIKFLVENEEILYSADFN